jgi:carbonic anhydrase/acetyltransferase-like protein (isoleucine patch superfamily)
MVRDDITIAPFDGVWPTIHPTAFIAPGCRIIGKVTIGEDASIWYNCVIRGDSNTISIGARTNIQDGSVVHCDSPREGRPEGFPTVIGDDVLIGHMAMIHGCTLEDRAFVGLATVVMDGCVIESDGMLGAGALLTPGKVIRARQLWMGRPATHVRDISEEAREEFQSGARHYVENGRRHAANYGPAQG